MEETETDRGQPTERNLFKETPDFFNFVDATEYYFTFSFYILLTRENFIIPYKRFNK